MPSFWASSIGSYFLKPLARWIGRGGTPTANAYAASCAAQTYDEDPEVDPLNGTMREQSQILAKHLGEGTAEVEGEEETRPVYALAQSQFLFSDVKLLAKHLGEATVEVEGEDDTRPVYGVSTCQDCLWVADYFNREDADNPGPDWEVIDGAAAIVARKLVIDEDDVLIRQRLNLPSLTLPGPFFGFGTGNITATVSSDTVGAHARIVGGWFDSNDYVIADYEFGATHGTLRMYVLNSGTLELKREPYIIPNRGVGVATRIRLCWIAAEYFNVEVEIEPNRWFRVLRVTVTGFFDPSGPKLLGFGHGLGSGDVAGGSVTIDNYQVRFGSTQKTHCPECTACHACPPDQQLCLFLAASYSQPARNVILQRTGCNLEVGSGPPRGYDTCCWNGEYEDDEGETHYFQAALIHQAEPNNYWAFHVKEFYPTAPDDEEINHWVYVFDEDDLPFCDTWVCLQLRHAIYCAFGIGCWTPELFDYAPLAPASISSGPYCPDCYLTSDNVCCGDVELPGTLYVTLTVNGEPIWTDEPFAGQQNPGTLPGGYEYTEGSDYFLCSPLQDPYFVHATAVVTILLTILSCAPYHAVGSFTTGAGDVYEVEIIE